GRGGGRVGRTGRGAGGGGAGRGGGEPADPEERRVGEQHLVGGVAADLVQVVEVPDQRAVRVDHALRRTGRARGVHDREPIARSGGVLRGPQHGGGGAKGNIAPPRCRGEDPAPDP